MWKVGDVCVCIKQGPWRIDSGHVRENARDPQYRETLRVSKIGMLKFSDGPDLALGFEGFDQRIGYRHEYFRPIEPTTVNIFDLAKEPELA